VCTGCRLQASVWFEMFQVLWTWRCCEFLLLLPHVFSCLCLQAKLDDELRYSKHKPERSERDGPARSHAAAEDMSGFEPVRNPRSRAAPAAAGEAAPAVSGGSKQQEGSVAPSAAPAGGGGAWGRGGGGFKERDGGRGGGFGGGFREGGRDGGREGGREGGRDGGRGPPPPKERRPGAGGGW
jgi:hypothetical protein